MLTADMKRIVEEQRLGFVATPDLQVLVDALEEESSDDHDYYIDAATIDLIADGRATDHLVALLKRAVGSSDGQSVANKAAVR